MSESYFSGCFSGMVIFRAAHPPMCESYFSGCFSGMVISRARQISR